MLLSEGIEDTAALHKEQAALDRHRIRTCEDLLTNCDRILPRTSANANAHRPLSDEQCAITTAPSTTERLLSSAADAIVPSPIPAKSVLDTETRRVRIPTGFAEVDAMLGGGIAVGQVTEVIGSHDTAAFCHSLCAAAVCASGGTAIYVDTCGSFSPQRLAAYAAKIAADGSNGSSLATKAFLGGVRVARCPDADAIAGLMASLAEWGNGAADDDPFLSRLSVVAVDSIAASLCPIVGGGHSGHATMVRVARHLKSAAAVRGIAVVVTNWVVGSSVSPRPALGETWRAVAQTQLALDRRGPSQVAVTVLRTPRGPSGAQVTV